MFYLKIVILYNKVERNYTVKVTLHMKYASTQHTQVRTASIHSTWNTYNQSWIRERWGPRQGTVAALAPIPTPSIVQFAFCTAMDPHYQTPSASTLL